MLKQPRDFDALGAEALPGGYAEIRRILQPGLEPVQPQPQIREGRGIRKFFALRKKRQDAAA